MSLWWSERCVLWPEINESLSRLSRLTLIDLGQSVYQLSHYIVWRTFKAPRTLCCFAEKRIYSQTYTIVHLHVFKCILPLHCRLTYPSFSLDVYCNDSTNPLAPTFDVLGTYVQKYICVIMYVCVSRKWIMGYLMWCLDCYPQSWSGTYSMVLLIISPRCMVLWWALQLKCHIME